jgi:hypothetical protein
VLDPYVEDSRRTALRHWRREDRTQGYDEDEDEKATGSER